MGERPRKPDAYERAINELIDRLMPSGGGDRPHLPRAVIADRLAKAAGRMARLEVHSARELDGATWQQVGDAFGIIRQSAHERFHSGPDGPHLRSTRRRVSPNSDLNHTVGSIDCGD